MSDHQPQDDSSQPANQSPANNVTLDTFEVSTTETVVDAAAELMAQYANPVIDPNEAASQSFDASLLYYQSDCIDEVAPVVEVANVPESVQNESAEPEPAEIEAPVAEVTEVEVSPVVAEPIQAVESANMVEPAPAVEPVQTKIEPVHVEPVHVEPVHGEPVHGESAKVAKQDVVIAPKPAQAVAPKTDSEPAPAVEPTKPKKTVSTELKFADLELRDEVKAAVQASGYDTPTAIQAEIIPHMLEGRDVLAQSQTGTGKTAAFALPILSRVDVHNRRPQVLVLAPTRELAIQVAKSFSTYGAQLDGFNVAAIYGGQDYEIQLRQLRRGVQVVVGTPGRVIDHVKRGTLDLSTLDCLVLDEADEMLNMGFLEDVQFVLEQTPDTRQVALFSATLPGPIRRIADDYLNDPAVITIKTKTVTAASVRQRAVFVTPRDKVDVLTRILEVDETDGVIVFTKTKDSTIVVAEALTQLGLSAVALNGDMPQKVRERTIDQLKKGRLDVLVATDVAARGLDVPRISHVFNFDLPHDSESYIHRIGRTGRAGRKGEAIIFLTNAQRNKLRTIERATKQPIEIIQPPTISDINAARVKRFHQKITDVAAEQDLTAFKEMISQYAEETGKPMEIIAAALAEISQGGRPFLMKERPKKKREREHSRSEESFDSRDRFNKRDSFSGDDRPRRAGNGNDRRLGPVKAGMTRYRLDVGWQDGVKPGNIVGAVANEAGIDGEFIGPINIQDAHTIIDLPEGMPADIYQTLRNTWVAGKRLNLELAREEPTATGGGRDFSGPRRGKFAGNTGGGGGGHTNSGGHGGSGHGGGKKFGGGKRSFATKSRNNGSTAPSAKGGKKKFK